MCKNYVLATGAMVPAGNTGQTLQRETLSLFIYGQLQVQLLLKKCSPPELGIWENLNIGTVTITKLAVYLQPYDFYVECILGFTNFHALFRVLGVFSFTYWKRNMKKFPCFP